MERPYYQREEWRDVEPVPQVDGPDPLAVIIYPPGFEDVHDYFRATQQRNEFSERALELTASVIEHNSANYTAWYYRRRCLKELGCSLEPEVEFIDRHSKECPKNYQVWYHRRWLIDELAAELRSRRPGAEAETAVRELGVRELEHHFGVMQENEDSKNYNGWSHRQYIVSKFGLWGEEMPFVEALLREDVRNNSAWNHRRLVIRNTRWPLTEEARREEVDFVLARLSECEGNESAWNYLAALFGDGPAQVPWASAPAVEAFCRRSVEGTARRGDRCRFAVEALARIEESRGQVDQALGQYGILAEIDPVRAKYWGWRAARLREQTAAIR